MGAAFAWLVVAVVVVVCLFHFSRMAVEVAIHGLFSLFDS
jgi:hypothetical protein